MFGNNIAIFIALICAPAHTSTNARIQELQFERRFYRLGYLCANCNVNVSCWLEIFGCLGHLCLFCL